MSRPATIPMKLRHTGDSVSIAIEDRASEAARMRDIVRGLLPEWMSVGDSDDAIIVVSELVTNALVHGRPPRVLQVQIGRDGLVIDVSDGSSEPAVAVDPAGRVGGQGLRIIGRLSEAWGSAPNPQTTGGKHVWCTIISGADPTESL